MPNTIHVEKENQEKNISKNKEDKQKPWLLSNDNFIITSSRSLSRLCVFDSKTLVSYPSITSTIKKKHGGGGGLKCMAVNTASEAETKKSGFEIQTLTGWLLNQEQAGVIDAELTIVIYCISMACIIASEEEDVPEAVEEMVFDPLDGSSNIDAAVSTGSIFGIYSPNDECLADIGDDPAIWQLQLDQSEQRCIVNVCQPGDSLLAAGYCMYSSSVIFVLTIGKGVFAFTLDPMYGDFVLTQENIQIPKAGKIYAFNEGNYQLWDDNLKKYIDDLKDPGPSGKPYSARYIGSLVGDFHRTLLYGRIYGYARDKGS
ncbi:hypothetical protein NC652_016191 [Populus alba x Populus x berolinensis]|nr:hypothetical protein NC652_016191 [Populus alba x Populus x berolinensis]